MISCLKHQLRVLGESDCTTNGLVEGIGPDDGLSDGNETGLDEE